MGINKKLKKGFDLKIAGEAEKEIVSVDVKTFALKPAEFASLEKPKVLVKPGESVKAGDALYFDKSMPSVKFTSPVSGEVTDVVRGDKRKLLEIRVLADSSMQYKDFGKSNASDIAKMSREDVISTLCESGLWPSIIQRPFAVIANPEDTPKSIFISGFDSSPLSPDYKILLDGKEKDFSVGLNILKKLTSGKINLSVHSKQELSPAYSSATSVDLHKFTGPHPSGNVGVQIHHIAPINKGDVVWTLNPVAVAKIGKLFADGVYDASRLIALTGSEVKSPKYYKTYTGACVEPLLQDNVNEGSLRVISGNVLSGTKIDQDGYIGYYDSQVTVIPEGDDYRFFGSFLPSADRLSYSRSLGLLSFLNKFINPGKKYVVDANLNGEHRNFVASGVLEDVVPMDIFPVHLLKAIMSEDIDNMEALGIYEIAEEDLALCEYVDVSKHEVQKIVREGIDLMLNS